MSSGLLHEPDSASENELVYAIGRRDQDAMAEVFGRYSGAMLALAERLLRSKPLAEEVVQDVLLRLWRLPDRYDAARGSLRTFLLAQVHSRSIDVIRADEARRAREDRDTKATPPDPYDLEAEVLQRVGAGRVQDALGRLPDEERRPLVLAYFGGHTYRHVANLLEAPEGTVKSRIRSGLQHLRGTLAEAGVT